jgi:hypothetical protein
MCDRRPRASGLQKLRLQECGRQRVSQMWSIHYAGVHATSGDARSHEAGVRWNCTLDPDRDVRVAGAIAVLEAPGGESIGDRDPAGQFS